MMLIFVGVVGNFLPFYLISWSEQHIQSSTAGILMGVGPILTLILSHFLTKDDRFSISKINKTPIKPIQIEINFGIVNRSSFVKK